MSDGLTDFDVVCYINQSLLHYLTAEKTLDSIAAVEYLVSLQR